MEREVRVLSYEEAEQFDREFERNRTGEERLAALLELRNAWLQPDQRRLVRTYQVAEIPLSSKRASCS